MVSTAGPNSNSQPLEHESSPLPLDHGVLPNAAMRPANNFWNNKNHKNKNWSKMSTRWKNLIKCKIFINYFGFILCSMTFKDKLFTKITKLSFKETKLVQHTYVQLKLSSILVNKYFISNYRANLT